MKQEEVPPFSSVLTQKKYSQKIDEYATTVASVSTFVPFNRNETNVIQTT